MELSKGGDKETVLIVVLLDVYKFMPLHLKVYSNLRQWIEVTEKEKVDNKSTSLCILSQLHVTSRSSKFPE